MSDWHEPPMMEGPPGALTRIDGRDYLYFGGTSYLGLSGHPEVIEAGCAAMREYGVHAATSRSGFGSSAIVLDVERRAAEFFGTETSFYYASGYAGNHILVQALADRADLALIDESAHFSVEEASRLLGKPIIRFRHRDPDDLRRKLHEHVPHDQRPIVLTDGVFALSGALAPLDGYLEALREYETAALLVDDAHGFGSIGANGRGTLEHLGLWSGEVNGDPAAKRTAIFVCGTLSKAIGGYGGIIPGNRALFKCARRTSHYYEGASPPPAAAAGATAKALEIVASQPKLRDRLKQNAARLRAGLRALGLTVHASPAPIIALEIGTSDNMQRIHDELRRAGIIVPYFAAYSGSGAAGKLRIAVVATHTDEMLDRLVAELGKRI